MRISLRIIVCFINLLFILPLSNAQTEDLFCSSNTAVPFSINENNLTIWNGVDYTPVFIKGINLGIAVPGTFPGELAATREQYSRWLGRIREIGYNTIRLYTLHYPRFYEVLDSFNLAHPKDPIHIFQGVWLEESLENYNEDLYFLTDTFDLLIEETIDCMHGNKVIEPRFGKAFGVFDTDISKWVLSYIIGRELSPHEVLKTDSLHSNDTIYYGQVFSLSSGTPTETWITKRIEKLVIYERSHYETERPVSFSSWPTLDPLKHPHGLFPDEDTASIDLANLEFTNAPAGYFASYHSYPYYPDFISLDPEYQTYFDYLGPNSYLGYITDLKNHYYRFPLIIAEYGIPSSWGIAHYAQSGMNHGGFDEKQQGLYDIRLLHNIQDVGCGGGIQFAWIDEWFKRTWITDPIDYNIESRVLWHNITGAEQNFGMIAFRKDSLEYQLWDTFPDTCIITEIYVTEDYDFFHFQLMFSEELSNMDTIWISIDTYAASLGESILPTGDSVVNRAEFALRITNYSAELYVTRAYDLFGIWHGVSGPDQLYHSIPSNGAPWDIVRWKNSDPDYEIQYIGNLNVRRFDWPPSSIDAVVIGIDSIDIRLPWSLIQFVDPTHLKVMNDYRDTPETEDTISDGISISVFHDHHSVTPSTRFTWEPWNFVTEIKEVEKACVAVIEESLYEFNSPPIAYCDEYSTKQNITLFIDEEVGVMHNDYDIDGNSIVAGITDCAIYGDVYLHYDGSFSYTPDIDFYGDDFFTYQLFDGEGLSDTCLVIIEVENTGSIASLDVEGLKVYPNPAKDNLFIEYPEQQTSATFQIININGELMINSEMHTDKEIVDISKFSPGIYVVSIITPDTRYTQKLCVY
jgi:hypothetical protein